MVSAGVFLLQQVVLASARLVVSSPAVVCALVVVERRKLEVSTICVSKWDQGGCVGFLKRPLYPIC